MRTFSWVLALALLALTFNVRAQEEVLNLDFDNAEILSPDLLIDGDPLGQIIGTTIVAPTPDPNDEGSVISLTQGVNSQGGFVWIDEPFNLQDNKVIIEFDYWIRSSTSNVPADGMSVIFQFGDNLQAQGGLGGGLGTANFPTDYVSVAYDIWDNDTGGERVDPSSCGGGPNSPAADQLSCHIEVNQNNNNPGGNPALTHNWDQGNPIPSFTEVGDLGIPTRTIIEFDNGFISVSIQIEDEAYPDFNDPVTVIEVKLDDFPDPADVIIGFGASTGGANAHHEIDNLSILIDEPTERIDVEVDLGDTGGINCGGTSEVTGTVNGNEITFVPDSATYGGFIATVQGDGVVEDQFAGYGRIGNFNTFEDSDLVIANSGDLQGIYNSAAFINGAMQYAFNVSNGRYEVNLHSAELDPALADGQRRNSAFIEGVQALSHYSAAADAGGALSAIVNTFEVDVTDGRLDVTISDLSLLTTPPSDAGINAISYRRLGDTTGADLSGAKDDAPEALPTIEEINIIEESFDDFEAGECPEGWRCNGTMAPQTLDGLNNGPQVVDFSDVFGIEIDPRMRLTDVGGGIVANLWYEEQVDLTKNGFEAEFDVIVTRAPEVGIADGMTFCFVPGGEEILELSGDSGGAIGYSGLGVPGGFAVEFDSWSGSAGDASGFNAGSQGHVGLVVDSNVGRHIQHNVSFRGFEDNFPFATITDSDDPDVGQYRTGTSTLETDNSAGMHARVRLNNQRLQVWLSTVNQDDTIGYVYPETLVVDTLVSYGSAGLGQGYFGFTAANGGAVTVHEVDNISITLLRNQVLEASRTVDTQTYTQDTDGIGVSVLVDLDDDAGTVDVEIKETIPAGWSADGISNSGSLADGVITWDLNQISEDVTLTYNLIPADGANRDVSISGTVNTNDSVALDYNTSLILYQPLPFGRGEPVEIISDDYLLLLPGDCPEGMDCQGVNYTPTADDFLGRFRLAQDGTNSIGASAFFTDPIDLSNQSLTVEFDFYVFGTPDPADGFTLAFLDPAQNVSTDVGTGGGGMGYQGLSGFAVEVDLWGGPGDPSGLNPGNPNPFTHLGVIKDGIVASHVQHHLDFNPGARPLANDGDGWPSIFQNSIDSPEGVEMHLRVEYNNGTVEVYLSAPETVGGPAIDDELILSTVVTFPGAAPEDLDPVLPSTILGFTAGTGGANCTFDIDNLVVTTYEKTDGPVGDEFRRGDTDGNGALEITDPINNLSFQFLGTFTPPCLDAADFDDNGKVEITDPIANLSHQFLGTAPPAPPGKDTCGLDPTEDDASVGGDLGCANPPTNC